MADLKILVVEDDDEQIATWQRQIDRINTISKTKFAADYVSSQSEAESQIWSHKYDAAIIDIRLRDESGVNDATSSGNEVRDLLLQSEVLLIAHITGEPNAVHFDDPSYEGLLRVFTKGDVDSEDQSVHQQILEWLGEMEDVVETMRQAKSQIAAKMAELFYKSIWPRWQSWQVAGESAPEFVQSSIARHMVSHLYSTLLDDVEGRVHPEEWYFQPPSKDRFHTGDMVRGDAAGEYFVLVTPRCDLERLRDGDYLIFAKMDVISDWIEKKTAFDSNILDLKKQQDETTEEKRKDSLGKKIETQYGAFRKEYYGHRNGKFDKHFLPEVNHSPGAVHGPFFVDFSNISSVEVGSEKEKKMMKNKIAALSPEFVPALAQRLGTYISRIGSPDYSHLPESD